MHCLSGKLVRCSILVLASLTVCLSLVSYGKPASRGGRKSTQPEKVLRIRIPKEVDPEELTILEGVYANGLYCGPVDMKKGVHEYTRKLSAQTTSVKLLVYHPAYKMVAAEITAKEATLKKPFTPKFVPRPMVPLTAKFADTKGKPIAGREVALTLYLGEMEYFGYVDGTVFPQRVATATTDAAGEIHVSVPSLLDDPYFAKQERRKPGFGAELPCPEQDKGFGWFSVPYGIPAQRSYPEPVTLTMTYYGKISARIKIGRAHV